MSVINQKEYLKKYLSLGDEKKKKKRRKKQNTINDRVKIIDDDLDATHNIKEDELKEFLTAEDAPQVVGIVDERPLSMRVDDYRKSGKWKLVEGDDDDESNTSPHRITNKNSRIKPPDSDLSPPRSKIITKQESDTDLSPPRSKKNKRQESDTDLSPPRFKKDRKREISRDSSPPRYKISKKQESDTDLSPPRFRTSRKQESDTDLIHPRSRNDRKHKSDLNTSPRRNNVERKSRKSSFSDLSPKTKGVEKMTKTLDGKKAGLQHGEDLKLETVAFKQREDELFKSMSAEVSGRGAVPIMRDRKTGKKRNLQQEALDEMEKQKKEQIRKEKFDKWGKGLKQVEDRKEKIEQELHEMSKPLARYADDDDLERFLKEQEREGDPMLKYIRKKKRKEAEASGKPVKSQYDGEFMPNRFGIPPGHRWDGVDRSNGYEKQWFQVQNAKTAVEEEVYKWSTEDM